MNAKEFKKLLVKLGACKESKGWCEGKTLNKAWKECTNPNWMFWLLQNHKTETTDSQYRIIAIKCAREVQRLMKDQRSINALDVAERFANGGATKKELDAAWAAARDAAGDAAWAAAWAAAGVAAGTAAWVKQCDIIRAYIPKIKLIGLK